MNIRAFRELQLLAGISAGQSVTQRSLAKSYGLALGLTNLLIRRMVRKGYLTLINLDRKRVRYLITPQGLAEKTRLTGEYLEYSLYFYRQIRVFLERALGSLVQEGVKDLLLYGTGEVAEVAFLVISQQRLNITAVVDGQPGDGAVFMNRPVKSPAELPSLSFDRLLVASLKGRAETVRQLCEWGVPREKILSIPDADAGGMLKIDDVQVSGPDVPVGRRQPVPVDGAPDGTQAAAGTLSQTPALDEQKGVKQWT